MGSSCSSQKIQKPFSPSNISQVAEVQVFPRMPWINKYLQQHQERIILPYNPNSSYWLLILRQEYQLNVEGEGVKFDEIAPPDFLDDDILEPIEGDD